MGNKETNIESTACALPANSWDVCHEVALAEADTKTRAKKLDELANELNEFYEDWIGDIVICQGVSVEYGANNQITERYLDEVEGALGTFSTTLILNKPYLLASVTDFAVEYEEGADYAEPTTRYFIVSAEPGYETFAFTLDEGVYAEEAKVREWNPVFEEAAPAKIWKEVNDYYNFLIESTVIQYMQEAPKGTTVAEAKNWAHVYVATEHLTALEFVVSQALRIDTATTICVVSEGALVSADGATQQPVRMSVDRGNFAGFVPYVHKSGVVDLRIALCADETEENVTLVPCKFIVGLEVVNG